MVTINDDDLPITVAEKLITATKEISDDTPINKCANKFLGGDGRQDLFTVEEIYELSKYLKVFAENQMGIKE